MFVVNLIQLNSSKSKLMKTKITFIVLLAFSLIAYGQTIVSGTQNGKWTKASSPYVVVGDVITTSLMIEAGVEVLFKPGFYLSTYGGTFTVTGTADDPVVFKAYEGSTPGSWEGIIIVEPGTVTLDNFIVRNAVNGLTVRAHGNRIHPAVNVSNADISYCSENGVRVYVTTGTWNTLARPYLILTGSKVHHNLRNGCWLDDLANPKCAAYACLDIFKTSIYQNGGDGVYAAPGCVVNAFTSTIYGNSGNGLSLQTSTSLHNSIVASNTGYGFTCAGSLNGPDCVTYSCLANNGSGNFNNVSGTNFANNVQVNRNGDSTDIAFNLYSSPIFLDTVSGEFVLQTSSPCIDAGTEIYNAGTHFDPDGSFPEIGSYYMPSIPSVSLEPVDFSAVQVGFSKEHSVSLHNPGPDIMIIDSLTIIGDEAFSHSESVPLSINPNERIDVSIVFSPATTRVYEATLNIGDANDSLIISLSGYGFTDSTQVIQVKIPNINTYPLDTLIVPVNVNFPSGTTFLSAEISISGWENDFEFLSIDTTNSLIGEASWTWVTNSEGSLRFSSAGVESINGSGTLFYARFIVPASARQKEVTLSTSCLFNANIIPVLNTSGVVSVASTIMYGDVDLNKAVQAYDASLILQYAAGIISLDKAQRLNASVSSDNTVSALDASLILMYTVGRINNLPSATDGSEFIPRGSVKLHASIENSTILVPMIIESGENIFSFESSVLFDPDILTFDGVSANDYVIAANDNFEGRVSVVGACTNAEAVGEELVVLRFSVQDVDVIVGSKVILEQLRLNEADVATNVAHVQLSVNGIANTPSNDFRLTNYPNPFKESTKIKYSLDSPSQVRLTIYNRLGQVVDVPVNKWQDSGLHSVKWITQNLPAGLYTYKLEFNKAVTTQRMILLE